MIASTDKTNVLSHFVGLLFVIMAFSDVLQSREVIVTGALLSIGAFILCFPIKDKNRYSESMIFILFLIITTITNLFFTKNNFGGSVILLGSLFLSFTYFHLNKKTLTLGIFAGYLVTLLFISYHLFFLETSANLIYEGLSRNHAGFAIIFWTIFLLFHLKVTYNRFPIILPFITLIIAYFLFGRTSIVVSALTLLVVFFYKFKNRKTRIIAILVFLISNYYLLLKFGDLLTEETNFGEGLETSRWKLWRIYMETIDSINFFTGVDVTKIKEYNIYGGNPHNAFLKFHSRTGIGGLVFVALLFVSLLNYLKTKQYYIFWLLMLLILRAFFDSDILIGNFDFIFFIVTFYWIKKY
tara:strand:- start:6970 stop:8031 length:1062 start_codon:yes stop_codon:yes gene_type:complete